MSGPFLDSHVHLQDPAFDRDRDEAIDRAVGLGVQRFVCNGTSPDDWPAVETLAKGRPEIIPCFGLHPWFVKAWARRPWLDELGRYLERTASGVGEIGLDQWIEEPDMEAQVQAFEAQLGLARDLGRPATVHCLRAWGPLLDCLKAVGRFPDGGLVIHGFGGGPDLVRPLAAMGAYLSFAGGTLDDRRERARRALVQCPRERLLAETDAPDMPPPQAYRLAPQAVDRDGRYRNEPGNLPAIVEGLAQVRQAPPEDLARVLWDNGQEVWRGLP